ncbi:GntR family transcriptional regulator [Pseudalkalibacillus sp. A8]|uniref:GntR family transcriptional regulator n=1 Tax=Pseudalkalibacillus sp. A8 TaxID=3382641 RepID=UPI0038B430A1
MSKEAPPLYIQIKHDLKEKIHKGIWEPGEKIPNELDLCKVYDVSRTTVRDAINELVWEEYLIRRRAKGTYVLPQNEKLDNKDAYFTYLRSFTHEMEDIRGEANTLLAEISLIKANEHIAKALEINEGDVIIELKRIRGIGDFAVVYFKTYMKNNLNLSLDSKEYYGSLYELLRQKGVSISRVKEYLEAINPDEEIQHRLNIKENTPVLKRVRNTYSSNRDFIEYTEGYYIGDQYKYFVDLKSNT